MAITLSDKMFKAASASIASMEMIELLSGHSPIFLTTELLCLKLGKHVPMADQCHLVHVSDKLYLNIAISSIVMGHLIVIIVS